MARPAPDRSFQFGMADIAGNAFGFDRRPSDEERAERGAGMSLRPLLEQSTNSPMLIVNGADDIHIPQEDTLVFEGRRDTQVVLLADAPHCAMTKLGEVVPLMIEWLINSLDTTEVAR